MQKIKMQKLDMTKGSIARDILVFSIPLFLGQLMQQFYNIADAWVVGNFSDNDSFAAVSSGGSLVFLITGFFNGIAIGGGVIISKYFGAKDKKLVEKAIHNNFLFGIISSLFATLIGVLLVPKLLVLMNTPESVLPKSLEYFYIYFGGAATIIMYNICMAIMRALGDSIHPLYYLFISSIINVVLDIVCVALLKWGVIGAALATVVSQGISAVLCIIRMARAEDYTRLDFRKLIPDRNMMKEIAVQGFPTGIQNSVISVGNIVIQTNINAFGAYAMAGIGGYSKLEGFVFLPITCMSLALPTFISQNLGAKEYIRAKKGAAFGIIFGMAFAETIGILAFIFIPQMMRIFVTQPESVEYGVIHARTVSLFFFLLAFSHCAAGVMRGCGKAIVPMITMLAAWCVIRIIYVTVAIRYIPVFRTISCAYPITWSISSVVFITFLLKSDWTHAFER